MRILDRSVYVGPSLYARFPVIRLDLDTDNQHKVTYHTVFTFMDASDHAHTVRTSWAQHPQPYNVGDQIVVETSKVSNLAYGLAYLPALIPTGVTAADLGCMAALEAERFLDAPHQGMAGRAALGGNARQTSLRRVFLHQRRVMVAVNHFQARQPQILQIFHNPLELPVVFRS